MNNMNIYRHYFRKDADVKSFDRKAIKPIKNWEYPWIKPHGGFWASKLDTKNGWKDWCESEGQWDWCSGEWYDFCLKPDASILRLKTIDDIDYIYDHHPNHILRCTESLRLMKYLNDRKKNKANEPSESTDCYDFTIPMLCLNFERLLADGVDAVEVEIDKLYYALYGWDCDSILIMNPDIIVDIKEDDEN